MKNLAANLSQLLNVSLLIRFLPVQGFRPNFSIFRQQILFTDRFLFLVWNLD